MAYVNFVIPQSKNDLLSHESDQYFVRDVIGSKEIHSKLKAANQCLRDEGPDFIIENFDIYYSIFLRAESNQLDVMMIAHVDLHKAVTTLNTNLGFLLEDKDSLTDEMKIRYQNVTKMLLYAYVNIVLAINQKIDVDKQNSAHLKSNRKKKSNNDVIDDEIIFKKNAVAVLYNLLERELSIFWDPPVVEEVFINMISEVFYRFLESPLIKQNKELLNHIFCGIGVLIRQYNHGLTFNVRIAQLIKIHEHLVYCIPEGIKVLVNNFNCKSLIRSFIREITEWQTDEKQQDSQGTRYCSLVLTEMAKLMPDLMVPEVIYLNRYLEHESYSLRNSVLSVITEVILKVLSKENLSEEQKESRDDLLELLEDHIHDKSSFVRSKVIQHWTLLQKENAIPIYQQNVILSKIVNRLYDKGANVRKSAANCVTTFLTHNIYGSELQLSQMEEELKKVQATYEKYKNEIYQNNDEFKKFDELWKNKEEKLKEAIIELFQNQENQADNETEPLKEDFNVVFRQCIMEDKFKEAFQLCSTAAKEMVNWNELSQNLDNRDKANLFLLLMKTLFYIESNSGEGFKELEVKFKEMEKLESQTDFLSNCVEFLRQIDKAIQPMKELLESVSIGDMQEATDFFITAYKFKIERAMNGIFGMLKLMQRNEQDRKEYVVNAFKTIYLTTDASSMEEHTAIVVSRLIQQLKNLTYNNFDDFTLIMMEWTDKGILDNNVIDILWQYFTKQKQVSDEDSRAATELLAMAAKGRKNISKKNLKMIAAVAFTERGQNDLLFLSSACKLMAVAGTEKHSINDKNPPVRIKTTDTIWADLMKILEEEFFKSEKFYVTALTAAIELIYRMCSKPEKICGDFIQKISGEIEKKYPNSEIPAFVMAQTAHLLGEVAIGQLRFLDETTYSELKRRNAIREEKENKKKLKKQRKSFGNASSSKRRSRVEQNSDSKLDESELEGAEADDPEAEFILNCLENNIVTGNGLLAHFSQWITLVCERPDIYDCPTLQGAFSIALLRFMMVSSTFCEKKIQLVFTMLERTQFSHVKINILIQLADLLRRFPNIVEPWTPRIYENLKSENVEVRQKTFFVLGNLILSDMIRVQGHIAKMARCLVDKNNLIEEMSRNFFTSLSRRANNLYNVLPDIFSHLIEDKDLEETQLRHIMQFLFSLIEKNKQMENLVERFCLKFKFSEEEYSNRNVAFCLSLIQYTDKGLRKLTDCFPEYKRLLDKPDVYGFFKQIINTCNKSTKNEIKAKVGELEEKINSLFENNDQKDGDEPSETRTSQKKTPFKKPRGRAPKKKVRTLHDSDDDDDDSDQDLDNEKNKPEKSLRKSSRTRKVILQNDSDSESD